MEVIAFSTAKELPVLRRLDWAARGSSSEPEFEPSFPVSHVISLITAALSFKVDFRF